MHRFSLIVERKKSAKLSFAGKKISTCPIITDRFSSQSFFFTVVSSIPFSEQNIENNEGAYVNTDKHTRTLKLAMLAR